MRQQNGVCDHDLTVFTTAVLHRERHSSQCSDSITARFDDDDDDEDSFAVLSHSCSHRTSWCSEHCAVDPQVLEEFVRLLSVSG